MHYLKNTGQLSALLIEKDISTFEQAIEWVKHLPYQRISNPEKLDLTISENCGTCSSKHAFLKAIGKEQMLNVQLILAMYQMSEENTPGIGSVLKAQNLDFVPEAHCYLKFNGQSIDCTNPEADLNRIKSVIIEEREIEASQIGAWKKAYHKAYLKKWLESNPNLAYSLDQIWKIREACIAALSTNGNT